MSDTVHLKELRKLIGQHFVDKNIADSIDTELVLYSPGLSESDYNKWLNQIRDLANDKIRDLKKRHQDEITKIRNEHFKKVSELNLTIKQLKGE